MGAQKLPIDAGTGETRKSLEAEMQSQKFFAPPRAAPYPQRSAQVLVDIKNSHMDEDLKEKNKGLFGLTYCTTLYLCLTVALMLTIVCTSSIFLYDEYNHSQPQQFQGWCNIPMSKLEDMEQFKREFGLNSYDIETFHEDFDIGLADDPYANVDVPDFQDGKRGRFIHDFKANMTAIVDVDGHRCFIMPLDREAVLPPVSLMDMLKKMMDGYYNVNVDAVKQNMRVVIPPLKDLSGVGVHIVRECENMQTYELEKYTHSVAKRSVDEPVFKFREFAGNFMQEFNIVNLNDVLQYEKESNGVIN